MLQYEHALFSNKLFVDLKKKIGVHETEVGQHLSKLSSCMPSNSPSEMPHVITSRIPCCRDNEAANAFDHPNTPTASAVSAKMTGVTCFPATAQTSWQTIMTLTLWEKGMRQANLIMAGQNWYYLNIPSLGFRTKGQ